MKIIKYFYHNISIYKYCFYYNLPYQSICSSIRYRLGKEKSLFKIDDIIADVISIYTNNKNEKILKELKNRNVKNNEIKRICIDLNLAYKNVMYLIKNSDFNPNKVLILVYLKNNKLNYKGEKILTSKTLIKINNLIDDFLNNNKQLNYRELLLLYWLGFDIAKNYFLERINKEFVSSKAWKITIEYRFNNNYIEDIKSDIFFLIFKITDTLFPYNDGQIIKYINLRLKSLIPFFISQYGQSEISFDTLQL
jgi:hypothetical protein